MKFHAAPFFATALLSFLTVSSVTAARFCCPDPDSPENNGYFSECQGCEFIGFGALEDDAACLAYGFYNYPGGDPDDAAALPPAIFTDCPSSNICCCDTSAESGYEYMGCDINHPCYAFGPEECEALANGESPVLQIPFGNDPPICPDNQWITELCPAVCSCFGDPHFKTWAGESYDYHGECDLVFLTIPDSWLGPIDIHIRTKARYEYSYIETAALRIGEEVFEVAGWGQYLLNGVSGAQMPATIASYPIEYIRKSDKEHVFQITLPAGELIELSTFKDWIGVKVSNANGKTFGKSLGLMGQYATGKKLARDGKTEIDNYDEFGQEWQVQPFEPMLFQAERFPQAPDRCILPSLATKSHRRLGESVSHAAAEKACFRSTAYDEIEDCIFDVMASGDIEMAQAA